MYKIVIFVRFGGVDGSSVSSQTLDFDNIVTANTAFDKLNAQVKDMNGDWYVLRSW